MPEPSKALDKLKEQVKKIKELDKAREEMKKK
jgi:hypothetical protein